MRLEHFRPNSMTLKTNIPSEFRRSNHFLEIRGNFRQSKEIKYYFKSINTDSTQLNLLKNETLPVLNNSTIQRFIY